MMMWRGGLVSVDESGLDAEMLEWLRYWIRVSDVVGEDDIAGLEARLTTAVCEHQPGSQVTIFERVDGSLLVAALPDMASRISGTDQRRRPGSLLTPRDSSSGHDRRARFRRCRCRSC